MAETLPTIHMHTSLTVSRPACSSLQRGVFDTMRKGSVQGRGGPCQLCKDMQLHYDVITGIYMLDPLEAFLVSEFQVDHWSQIYAMALELLQSGPLMRLL